MMRFVLIVILTLVLSSCNSSSSDLPEIQHQNSIIQLQWNKAYPDDTIDKSVLGLSWALSYVGALLPSAPSGISVSSHTITLNLNKIGLNSNALEKLNLLHQKVIASEEYQHNHSVDLGRYVTLLLGASEHYYAIVGVPNSLDELLSSYILKPEKGYLTRSSISFEHRILQFSEQNTFNQVFVASEVDSVSHEVYEYETLEILPNGQLRFGIFDANGLRKNNADTSHSNAGKPARCLWCHESSIQKTYDPQDDVFGYLPALQLQNQLIAYNESLVNNQLNLHNGVAFSETQQHTLTELLYISFMEPSAARLSLEWNLPIAQVETLLSGLPTHFYEEFPFLGTLYDRNSIDPLAPYKGLPVSSSVREQSSMEVNHLN